MWPIAAARIAFMPIGQSRFSGPAAAAPAGSSQVSPIGDRRDSRSRKDATPDSCDDSHCTPGTAGESRALGGFEEWQRGGRPVAKSPK